MHLHQKLLSLVAQEKKFTAQVIQHLKIMDEQKLFSELGYHSLFHYAHKALGYSESEANIRVGAVRLARRSEAVIPKMKSGELSLTNASKINSTLGQFEKEHKRKAELGDIEKALEIGSNKSTRAAEQDLKREFKLESAAREVVVFEGKILEQINRAKKKYGDISTYELVAILLEEKLKTPKAPKRPRSTPAKVSRYIPVATKHQVYTGECRQCGGRRHLHYDHIKPHARGGTNEVRNLQQLCRNCNQRKEIRRSSLAWRAGNVSFCKAG